MRRLGAVLAVAAATALSAGPATAATVAKTETAAAGGVTATFTYQQGKDYTYSGLHLQIARDGQVLYDRAVTSHSCYTSCQPAVTGGKSVQVLDLEHDGSPDVLLQLFSGGAHCCVIAQVFRYDAATNSFGEVAHDFGDPGYSLRDLRHDGRLEFLTADDAFAYAFTDYAASGLPIQILDFSGGRFRNVTRGFPGLIRRDAAFWLRAYNRNRSDPLGLIAAWAADEDLLGRRAHVAAYLQRQARLGRLHGPAGLHEPSGERFIRALNRFLRRYGYLR